MDIVILPIQVVIPNEYCYSCWMDLYECINQLTVKDERELDCE